MKKFLPLFLLAGLLLAVAWLLPITPLGAQSRQTPDDQYLPLARQVAEQQKTLAENQIAIEKSVLVIKEEIRQAKIYSARSGGTLKK